MKRTSRLSQGPAVVACVAPADRYDTPAAMGFLADRAGGGAQAQAHRCTKRPIGDLQQLRPVRRGQTPHGMAVRTRITPIEVASAIVAIARRLR
jgi:hypothetical protein